MAIAAIAIQGGAGTEPELETGTVGTIIFREPKAEPELSDSGTEAGTVQLCSTIQKHREFDRKLFPEEPSEPKTGTVRTVLSMNHNRTQLNRDHPRIAYRKYRAISVVS